MKQILKIVTITLLPLVAGAQDIHFSQFAMSPLTLNPALAGNDHVFGANLNYKNQWGSVASPYKTIAVSTDGRLTKPATEGSGYWVGGINFYNDKAGDAGLSTTQVNLTGGYYIKLNQYSALGTAFQGGFANRTVNMDQLTWGNQYSGAAFDPSLPTGEPADLNSVFYWDLSGGMNYMYQKNERYMTGNDQLQINAGFAFFHVNQPKYSFYDTKEKLDVKWSAHGDVLFGVANTDLSILPGFFYYQQGPAKEVFFGSSFKYILTESSKETNLVKGAALNIGAYYRTSDAIVATASYEWNMYAIGISYDFNVSDLKDESNGKGGFEISLRFRTPNPFM
jgi:type IX secretion system PorP/SprF family membrane protein